MSAKLPYFPWYPQDCDTDERVRTMTDQEFGFFVRCLNHSWVNDGLPDSVAEIARIIGRTPAYATRMWKRIGPCFELHEGRLRNPRQEQERIKAKTTSLARSNAAASRWDKQTECKSNANAYGLQSYARSREPEPDTDSKSEKHTHNVRAPLASDQTQTQTQTPSTRFEEFWEKYPRKQHRNQAAQAWCSVVTVAVEAQVFACEVRYCGSDEVSRGVVLNPEKWLFEQAADGWAGAWPPRNGTSAAEDEEVRAAVRRLMR